MQLKCIIGASTDAATLINVAQHSYFNLGGHGSGTILDHHLHINGCVWGIGSRLDIRTWICVFIGAILDLCCG